jgi:hypothetical protein
MERFSWHDARMLHHIVLFRWTADATDEQRQAVADRLAALPRSIPEIRSYQFGTDLGLANGNYDFGLVAQFDDGAALAVYQQNDDHQAVIRDVIKPIVAERVAVQFVAD